MKTTMLLVLIGCCCMFVVGCGHYSAPVKPPSTAMITIISSPMFYNSTTTKVGSKTGEASVAQVLGIVAAGNASIKAAADDGNITKIHHVDYKYQNYFFGIYTKFTTIVNGE